jgi:hypothetical protein
MAIAKKENSDQRSAKVGIWQRFSADLLTRKLRRGLVTDSAIKTPPLTTRLSLCRNCA